MAAVLKVAVVALAVIAAEKKFTAADGTTVYNIRQFLEQNPVLMTMRTTYSSFNPCQWYQRESESDSGVTVSTWVYIHNTNRTTRMGDAKNWSFKGTDTMWLGDEEDGIDEKKLIYQTTDGDCGVIQYDEYFDGSVKNSYELLVTKGKIRNVPEQCKNFYLGKINGKPDSSNKPEDLQNCKYQRNR
uniref:Lipocalin n=1 Tax=Rhipicephalus zambeziensis TaxID=60191 RepID=A0A224YHY7_9ACAR